MGCESLRGGVAGKEQFPLVDSIKVTGQFYFLTYASLCRDAGLGSSVLFSRV